jgi:hypothetical protein
MEQCQSDFKHEASPVTARSYGAFDLSKIRLSQDYTQQSGTKKVFRTIAVQKPGGQEFVRVHPDEDMRLETAVLELKEDRETYLVDRELWQELRKEIVPKVLYTTINRLGVVTLWPIRLPRTDGRLDKWSRSALDAAQIATTAWVRLRANQSLGAYQVHKATGSLSGPEWPALPFQQILSIAFKDRFIQDFNHPALRRLRGEI